MQAAHHNQDPRPIGTDELLASGRLRLLSDLVDGDAKLFPHGVTDATEVTGIHVTPSQYDLAHAAMAADLEGRDGDTPTDGNQEAHGGDPNTYLTAEELSEGKRWYGYIERHTTPQSDGVNFRLTAKFHSRAGVPGLDTGEKEWQTIIPDEETGYRETTYRTQSPDFLFAGAVQQSVMNKDFDTNHRGANLLVMYPSPTHPEQTVCSYGMVFDPSNFPGNEANRAPSPDFVSLDFEIPTEISNGFTHAVHQNPRRLEALLQATSYGQFMHTVNPRGPILRVPADRLAIVRLPSGAYVGGDATIPSRLVANDIVAAADSIAVPYDPPIGR
jgi:hypothetical protein